MDWQTIVIIAGIVWLAINVGLIIWFRISFRENTGIFFIFVVAGILVAALYWCFSRNEDDDYYDTRPGRMFWCKKMRL